MDGCSRCYMEEVRMCDLERANLIGVSILQAEACLI